MKAVKKYSNPKVHFKMVEEMEPLIVNEKDVKIKIDAIGICTSDIHVLHGAMNMPDNNTVGHEFSGTIVALGKDVRSDLKVGDKVVSELAKGACMTCKICKEGHYELCPKKQPPGWVSQGIYAEYTVQPDYCIHKLPANMPMDIAAMAEPIAICVYGCIERGKINKDDFTVIYGMGSIGLFTLITLIDYGVKNIICVTSTKKSRDRLDLAKELGANIVMSTDEEIEKKVIESNGGWKADCVIDCSGAPSAINEGISILKKGGKFIALGLTNENEISFTFNRAVLNLIEMIFSATSSHEAWVKTVGILERNKDKIKKVVSHSYPLEEWATAYAKLESREAIKAVLRNQ